MRIVIYPGTFDPITNGHMDILQRATKMFDHVYVVIMKNPTKKTLLTEEERCEIIKEAIADAGITNATVEVGHGLTIDYAKQKGAIAMIRGLRALMDFDYELQIASANYHMDSSIETIFIPTRVNYSFISSTVIKELAAGHKDLEGLVPQAAIKALQEKYENH